MHRLAGIALTLLLLIASIFPAVLARETNADRLRRGYPPLPPGRRETAKRSGPSAVSTPPVIFGVLEVRDKSGTKRIGFGAKQGFGDPIVPVIGVIDPNQPASQRLQVNFTLSSHNLAGDLVLPEPVNPSITPPFCINLFVGSPPLPLTPSSCCMAVTTGPWSLDPKTNELTVTLITGESAVFAWEQALNEIEVLRSGDDDPQAVPVRLFLAKSN